MHYVAFRFCKLFGFNRDVNSGYMYPQFTLLARLMVISAGNEGAWGGSEKAAKLAPLQSVEKNFGSLVVFDPSYWFIVINWGQRGIQDGHLALRGKAPWDSNRQSAPLHQFPDDRSDCWRRKVGNKGVNEQMNKTRCKGGGETRSEEMKRIPQALLVN